MTLVDTGGAFSAGAPFGEVCALHPDRPDSECPGCSAAVGRKIARLRFERDQLLRPEGDQMQAPDDGEVDPLEAFWTARPILTHIRDFARARRAGPWAVLGVALTRAVASVEPNVVLPATIGAPASLNLFLALVGQSSGGKGIAERSTAEGILFVRPNGAEIPIDILPPGSGEGIAKTFLSGDDDEEGTGGGRALFSAPEVDTLTAIGSRQGATIMAELRKLYMGEQLGFANAQKHTRVIVPSHSYRACVIVGVQPLKAKPLLADADGGTPQRFVWLPVDDPGAPDVRPEEPEPQRIKIVDWQARVEMGIPVVARDTIDRHRVAVLRGEDVDPLDGHKMLTRLKIAAAFAILDTREKVTEEDWQLAGTVIRVSDRTRASIERTLTERAKETTRARALAKAEEAGIIADRTEDRERDRIRGAILRCLERRGTVSRKDLRNTLKSSLRDRFDAELAELLEAGEIVAVGDTTFRMATS